MVAWGDLGRRSFTERIASDRQKPVFQKRDPAISNTSQTHKRRKVKLDGVGEKGGRNEVSSHEN